MKLGIIGHFGGNKNFLDGQTVKTKEINSYLEEYFHSETFKFDTYKNARNPFKLIYLIRKTLKNSDIVIVVLAQRGYKIITPILMFFNKFYKRRIFDVVIGGTRYNIYNKNNLIFKSSKKYECIFVETKSMLNEYLKRGLNNVVVMPNFKKLSKARFNKTGDTIKLCIFSRIIKEKGIEEAVKAVIQANNTLGKDIFVLDIYGHIGDEYKEEFNSLLHSSSKYVSYKGEVNYYESVDVINKYDLMLFLTYYKNEGFAGTILDAFYAGIPVITTKWNSNSEIIKDYYNGLLVNIKDVNEVENKLIMLYNNKELIDTMKKNALKESDKYNINKVLKSLVMKIKK